MNDKVMVVLGGWKWIFPSQQKWPEVGVCYYYIMMYLFFAVFGSERD